MACSAIILGSGLALAEAGTPEGMAAVPGDVARALGVEVIFTGFVRRTDKGAAIFVRMTGEVPVETIRDGQRLTYRLSGARLGVRNNANPLPTELFGPPVSNVALIASNTGVDLVIDLSPSPEQSAPTHRFIQNRQLATLLVELAPAAP
jgi:hypothetical protein